MSSAVQGLVWYLQGYTCDREKAFWNTMALVFPHSFSYICKIYGKKNVSEKCSTLSLSSKFIQEIREDSFSQGSWIYARSSKMFSEQRHQLKSWVLALFGTSESMNRKVLKITWGLYYQKMLDLVIRLSLPIQLNPEMLWLSRGTNSI